MVERIVAIVSVLIFLFAIGALVLWVGGRDR